MNKNMEFYVNLVYFLKQTLSCDYEIFLFDTTDKSLPVVAMSAKDRENEKRIRRFVLSALNNDSLRAQGMVLNRAVEPAFGKLIRGSVLFIRGTQNEIIGALCVAMHCGTYLKMQETLYSLLQFDLECEECQEEASQPEVSIHEVMPQEPSMAHIEQAIAELDIDPTRMTQDEKLEFICDLYDINAFRVKGSVARVADFFKMSEQSIYRYIQKIKKARNG